MAQIHFLTGDATQPSAEGTRMITHICNDIGGWGAGFVLALSKRWKTPEKEYRKWYKDKSYLEDDKEIPFELGKTQFVQVESSPATYVANMIAQQGIRRNQGLPPIRYEALRSCLQTVCNMARKTNASIHMPRIGCGLAGGKWEEVEAIIADELVAQGVDVYVYDFKA